MRAMLASTGGRAPSGRDTPTPSGRVCTSCGPSSGFGGRTRCRTNIAHRCNPLRPTRRCIPPTGGRRWCWPDPHSESRREPAHCGAPTDRKFLSICYGKSCRSRQAECVAAELACLSPAYVRQYHDMRHQARLAIDEERSNSIGSDIAEFDSDIHPV